MSDKKQTRPRDKRGRLLDEAGRPIKGSEKNRDKKVEGTTAQPSGPALG